MLRNGTGSGSAGSVGHVGILVEIIEGESKTTWRTADGGGGTLPDQSAAVTDREVVRFENNIPVLRSPTDNKEKLLDGWITLDRLKQVKPEDIYLGMSLGVDYPSAARAMTIGPEDVKRAQAHAPEWADLFNWTVPDWLPGKLAARSMRVQRIQDAVGELNLDRYEVRVTTVPSGWDAVSLLNHVRTHLNEFIDTRNSEFIPYDVGVDDVQWTSPSPAGTVFKIDIVGPDNAAVVASLVERRRWRFTTINTAWSGDHPVSGHREFGVSNDLDGTVVFYTRGADRSTHGMGETLVFAGGDHLWRSFQNKLTEWINANGGSASSPPPFSERFHPHVVRMLYGTSQLPETSAALSVRSGAYSLSGRALEIPLDPGVGGMSIGVDALQPGDIIVSTARHAVSYAIRAGTLSAISHAMLYVGNGKVIEAVGSGVREVAIEQAVGDALLAVAYRDSRINASIAQAIVDHARSRVSDPYNYAGVAFTGYRILNPLPARVIVGHLKGEDVPLGIPLGLGDPSAARRGVSGAMSGQSFAVHWDTAPYYPQSSNASCWAASAAMVVGWRDGRTVSDAEIADKVPVIDRYTTGMWPTDGSNGGKAIGTGEGRRVNLDDWPYVPAGEGEARLPLIVSWHYVNGAVGDVRITAGEARSMPGWTHRVTADITEGPETPQVAAVRIIVCHKFASSGRPEIVAVTELTLFGDGTYQRQDRWEQAQAAAA